MKDLLDYKKIIFSDIDGTFAGNDMNYDHGISSIAYLDEHHTLLVLVSSKPLEPILKILQTCNAELPFIFENGGGIYIPKKMSTELIGLKYKHSRYKDGIIIKIGLPLTKLKSKFLGILNNFPELDIFYPDNPTNFEGSLGKLRELFEGWDDEMIREGVIAKKFFDLAFHINNEKVNKVKADSFIQSLTHSGMEVSKGGIFYHATQNANKGIAVKTMLNLIKSHKGYKLKSIGIGDGNNDLPFLREVDKAYLLYNKENKHVKTDNLNNINFINLQGPKGFIQLIQNINSI